MFDDEAVTIKTVGRFFPHRQPPIGVWSAGIQWPTPWCGQEPRFLHGESEECGSNGHNIGADVLAVLAALRFVRDINLPVKVYTVNRTVRDTIPLFYDKWKANGWRKPKGGRPSCLAEWQEIKAITEIIQVTWHERTPTKADKIADYEQWAGWLSDPDDAYLYERAMARDPW